MSSTHPDSRRIVELDGLRGVAVLLVLLAHYFGEVPSGWSFLALGWLGVDVFFVLSGFLIAGILLDHRGAANYFSTFYIRRSCRIFPIYFVFIPILVLFLSSLWARGHAWMEEPLPFAAYLSYTQNFAIAWQNRTGGLALLPTWTLAIEEQFYMLLPLMVYFVPRKRLLPICLGLIAVSPILRSMILYQYGSHLSVHVLLPCRWDSLFLGVIAAIVLRDSKLKRRVFENGGRCLKSIWVAGYSFLPLVILVEQSSEIPLRMSIAITAMAMGTAAYILLVVTRMTSVPMVAVIHPAILRQYFLRPLFGASTGVGDDAWFRVGGESRHCHRASVGDHGCGDVGLRRDSMGVMDLFRIAFCTIRPRLELRVRKRRRARIQPGTSRYSES